MGYLMYYVNDFDAQCTETKLQFLLVPRKCSMTGKLLWLTLAYKRVALYINQNGPILVTRYYDKENYLFAKLKGDL